MQKLLFPLALAVTSLTACAQNSHLDKFYHKYQSSSGNNINDNNSSDATASGHTGSGSGNSVSIDISPAFMLNACFSGSGNTNDGWIRKVTNLRLLILDEKKNPGAGQEWTDLEQSLQQDHFEDLLTIRKGKDRVRLLSKEGAGGMKEVAFLVAGKEGGGLFFHFRGTFTEKDMATIESFLQSHDSQ